MNERVSSVRIRILAPDQKTLQRAITQAEHQLGVSIPMPAHPGRKGDWMAYFNLDIYIPPDEPTRRRPQGHGVSV